MKSGYKTLSENFKERDHFGDIGVDTKIKFKYYHKAHWNFKEKLMPLLNSYLIRNMNYIKKKSLFQFRAL